MTNPIKRRNSFPGVNRAIAKQAKNSIRATPGQKTEAEIKAIGIHCVKIHKERGFSPAQRAILERQRESQNEIKKNKRFHSEILKSLKILLKEE